PITYNIKDPLLPGTVERANKLQQGEILAINWVKDPARRSPMQRIANIRIITSTEDAATLLRKRGLILLGGQHKTFDPRQDDITVCYNCQRHDGHFAASCPNAMVCGWCGSQEHDHRVCTVQNPEEYFCVNCGNAGHATWDHAC
ncbi:hypothetical protein OF83DRAFT_1031996, partial [Amylostereum chailletii]